MLNDFKYFESPTLFHAIVHAQKTPQNNPPSKFAAFMLLFRQQSYFKPRWATLSLQKTFFSYKMLHKFGSWFKHLESTDTYQAFLKLKPKAAYAMFSNLLFQTTSPHYV